jgi:hypothetical protein
MRTEFDPGFVDGALLLHLQFDYYNYLMSGTHGVSLGADRMPVLRNRQYGRRRGTGGP